MTNKKNYIGLDIFRPVAALLVVAIHTSPLVCISAGADFFLTRVIARLAVPFFFMVTGQFILSDYMNGTTRELTAVWKYIRKISFLYGISILLYIPLGIYAGYYEKMSLTAALQMLIFDGTFYHLWYFPALILGIWLLCLLRRFCSMHTCNVVAVILYLLGLLGDSYWGLISNLAGISTAYEFGFRIFNYTRNGIFLAPLFLLMGTWFHSKTDTDKRLFDIIGLITALLFMTIEGFTLRHFDIPRHDSMYLTLPLCMFFLYRLLLSYPFRYSAVYEGNERTSREKTWSARTLRACRTMSTWIYILHPAMIVVVRGTTRLFHIEHLLVENSLVHYIAVCILSLTASLVIAAFSSASRRSASSRHTGASQTDTIPISKQQTKSFGQDRAWIELDRAALRHNVSVLRSLLPENCELMPAVKANAYGHGAVLIARELNNLGVTAFCTACIEEGIELRKNGIKGEILILGYTHPKQFPLLHKYHLTQTVIDYAYAKELNHYGQKLHVHIGIDTGMHRLGERSEHIDKLCKIFRMKNLEVDGAYTHLCAADSDIPDDRMYTVKQAQAFYHTMNELNSRGVSCPKIHLQSSYGVLNYPKLAGDYARVGIVLYGVRSGEHDYDLSKANLQPVLSLKARIAAVKRISPGETAGYGLAFVAERPTRIAILTIGYADGLPRSLSCGVGSVLIHGQNAPIIGRICMDQTLVDITGIADVHSGDVAVIIGRSGDETISVYEIAEECNTITNEVLSRMGGRLKRTFIS